MIIEKTRTIPVSVGKFAIIDDIDYERVAQHLWACNAQGYAAISKIDTCGEDGLPWGTPMARFIFGLERGDKRQVDHINHDTLDNRRCNLRICTGSQNHKNRLPNKKTETSKYKGVCWSKGSKKWIAQIKVDGKETYLGLFDSERAAALAYNLAAKKYFGEFALLNKI